MSDRIPDVKAQALAAVRSLKEDGGSPGLARKTAKSWEKFSHWVSCMCIVTFDLELGQALEVCISC